MDIQQTIAGVSIALAIGLSGIAAAAVGIAINLGISILASQLLAKKPEIGKKEQGRTGNVRSPVMPHEVVYGRVRKGGLLAYTNGTGKNNDYLHMFIVVASHRVKNIEQIQFDGEKVILDSGGYAVGKFHDAARIQKLFGHANQLALPDMVTENDNWTDDHRARGRAAIYARLQFSPKAYSSFIPKITSLIEGKDDVYDPRDTEENYTDNPALIVADILEDYLGIPRSRIDQTALTAAANICDETVTNKDGSTDKRYTASGYFLREGSVEEWLEGPIKAMAGGVVEHAGIYYIHAGKWVEPVLTITDDDITGSITLQTAKSDSERYNVASGTFVAEQTFEQPTDFPPYKDTAAIAADGGVENELDLDLEWVTSPQQAQRVAKILLQENRLDEQLELEVSLEKGLDIKPWDTVTVDSSVLGINTTYRVANHVLDVGSGDAPIVVRLALKAHAASVYDWDAVTEEQPFSSGLLVVPGSGDAPTITDVSLAAATSSTSELELGTVTIDYEPPPNVDFDYYEFQVKLQGEYRAAGTSDPWVEVTLTDTDTQLEGPATGSNDVVVDDGTTYTEDYDVQNVVIVEVRARIVYDDSTTSAWAVVQGT